MGVYLIRRVFGLIPMIFIITVITFLMMHAAPGDAFSSIMNPKIKNINELQAALRHVAGYDQPLPMQYVKWIKNFFIGDWGYSYVKHEPVLSMITPALVNTVILSLIAQIISIGLGIPIGILQSRFPYSKFDYTTSTILFIFFSIPSFIFGIILIYVFAINLGFFPAQGAIGLGPSAGSLGDHLYHAFLPATALILLSFVSHTRYIRGAMLDVKSADYTRTAYAKGLKERKVFTKHVFRNAMIPSITQWGFDIAALVGGSIILEGLFQYQGMGLLTIDAVNNRDYPVIMATTIIYAVAILIGNLIADILYAVVDPRIRYK
jgi:peptide/nickel transport system permease protein